MMMVTVPVTISVDDYQTLAAQVEANDFGDLTMRQSIEILIDSAVTEIRSGKQ